MGNTYARLWDVVPEEKRYFVDPPFANEFYNLVANFIVGFPRTYQDLSVTRFYSPIQWNTLVYDEDLVAFKYSSQQDASQSFGYVSEGAEGSGNVISEEKYEDGTPHLQLKVDDQDRRLFVVWNLRQLANVIAITDKTWDMEIASVLFFQPDPVSVMFGNKYDVGDIKRQDMLATASSRFVYHHVSFGKLDEWDVTTRPSDILRAMEDQEQEPIPYQKLYMLLQQFDLFYLYRRMFMHFDDNSYLDPNLPYREVGMLEEMSTYGDDAPLKEALYLNGEGESGWSAPLFRQVYGDVDYVVLIMNDDKHFCLTINVTGIYENNLIHDEEEYYEPSDTNLPTLVMWLKENNTYFREHFTRAAYRFETRKEMTRAKDTKLRINEMNLFAVPRKYMTMDKNEKFVLRDHLHNNPIIRKKTGYWTHLREVHKNQHSANKMLYITMADKDRLFPKKRPVDEHAEEEKRVDFLSRKEIGNDEFRAAPLPHRFPLQPKSGQTVDKYPEDFPFDPKQKGPDGHLIVIPESAATNPYYWPIYRIHRLMRWGCAGSVCAAALLLDKKELFDENNSEYFHQYPVVEVALNVLEVDRRQYGRQKFEVLELLTRFCQSRFTLRQINFYDGIKAILGALKSRFLEVKSAAAVSLTTLQELVPKNQQIIGRDGGLQLLVDVMLCPSVKPADYWYHNYFKKHKRIWPEEVLVVTASQAACAVWLALKDRRNRYDFVKLHGIEVCKSLLRKGKAPDYATMPVIGILAELAHEVDFHSRILKSGALWTVCKVLSNTNNENVFQNASAFIALMCDYDAAREVVRQAKGLEPLLKPLKTSSFWLNQGCMQISVEAVYKCAISVVNCDVFRTQKAIELALDRLYEGVSEATAHNILGLLSEAARTEAGRITIRSSGAFPFLMDYMQYHNQFIRMKAALCTGRTGADKDAYGMIVESNAILQIWHLFASVYAPIVSVHACMAVFPLFVANPKDTAKIIRTIINPFGPVFDLLKLNHPRVTDAVLNLICLLAQDNDLLAIMSDCGFCEAVAKFISSKDVRTLRFVTEAIARGSEYAINRINFSNTDVVPRVAKLLWHPDTEVQANALYAIYELTKYPQNIVQVHTDRVARRLLSYLMEGTDDRARTASGCLKHMRYLAMANMGDTYNFEDTFFALRPEERNAISRTKRELLMKTLAPEAKLEADRMRAKVKKMKRSKMRHLPLPPLPTAKLRLGDYREKLPDILKDTYVDTLFEKEQPPLDQKLRNTQDVKPPTRTQNREPGQVRQDRVADDWRMPTPTSKTSAALPPGVEWWMDDFDDENYKLFNRLTVKNNYCEENVDATIIRARPTDWTQTSTAVSEPTTDVVASDAPKDV